MKNLYLLLLLIPFLASCQTDDLFCGDVNTKTSLKEVNLIAFGSCANQNNPQPVLTKVNERHPDVFCWLGDNIYADTKNMKLMRKKYSKLGCKAEFRELNKETHFLAVWDDHDYGKNDAGKEYPMKEESKNIFLDFYNS